MGVAGRGPRGLSWRAYDRWSRNNTDMRTAKRTNGWIVEFPLIVMLEVDCRRDPRSTLRVGPTLIDSVERRAVSLLGLAGTIFVIASFSRGRQFLQVIVGRARRSNPVPQLDAAEPPFSGVQIAARRCRICHFAYR